MVEADIKAEIDRIPAEALRFTIPPEHVDPMPGRPHRIGRQFFQQRLDRRDARSRRQEQQVGRSLVPQEEGAERPLDADEIIGFRPFEAIFAERPAGLASDDQVHLMFCPWDVGNAVDARHPFC